MTIEPFARLLLIPLFRETCDTRQGTLRPTGSGAIPGDTASRWDVRPL